MLQSLAATIRSILSRYARTTTHNWHTGNRVASDSMPVCLRGLLMGRQCDTLSIIATSLTFEILAPERVNEALRFPSRC
jgi:hypothetical protein